MSVSEGRVARDEGIALAVQHHPEQLVAAFVIIVDAAMSSAQLSSNSVRPQMDAAKIRGPIRGGAFRAAVKANVLAHAGHEASESKATHARPVRVYSSLIFQAAS